VPAVCIAHSPTRVSKVTEKGLLVVGIKWLYIGLDLTALADYGVASYLRVFPFE
jgi:hypothetical protein